MNEFSKILDKAKELEAKMKESQEKIKKIEVEGQAGGNLVKVILTGDYELKSIIISEEAKKESQEIINDLIKAAYNNAKENLKKNLLKNFPKQLELQIYLLTLSYPFKWTIILQK